MLRAQQIPDNSSTGFADLPSSSVNPPEVERLHQVLLGTNVSATKAVESILTPQLKQNFLQNSVFQR